MQSENEVTYNHELSILDDKLIAYLELDTDEVSEIPLTIKFETEATFATYVPFGDTSAKLCGNSTEVQIYSIQTPLKGQMTEIKDVMSKQDLEWLECQISEGSLN